MMETIRAIILGIIQGLTEFLPVSSSGHLELGKYFLGDSSQAEESLLMTITLHVATALSTVWVFRKDILDIVKGLLALRWNDETRFALQVVISMIPAALVGLFFEDQIETLFNGNILLVGFNLIITGLLLFLADRSTVNDRPVKNWQALVVGISQAIAILPGISRSGATIATSVLLHIDRKKAARFSFLMVLPLIFGKMVVDLADGSYSASPTPIASLIAGFLAAFLVGLFACRWMIRIVQSSKLSYFAYYCFAVGILSIALIYLL